MNSGVVSVACRERAQINSIGVPYICPVLGSSLEERQENPGASLGEDCEHEQGNGATHLKGIVEPQGKVTERGFNVYKCLKEAAKSLEPSSAQWCPATEE